MVEHFDIAHLKKSITDPPLISADLPGIGGQIKTIAEHFQVEEMLPYEPSGQGEHLFVKLRRKGWNTTDVARALAKVFGLRMPDIGWGGRKDKNAVTTQTFSLPLPLSVELADTKERLETLPFEILAIQRHKNKIKTGHVAGNRFEIVVSHTEKDGLSRAEAIAGCLSAKGLPNYYGTQRFGHQMGNLDAAWALLIGRGNVRGRKNACLVSALQSALFNFWLQERMRAGRYDAIVTGDIAKKTDTGGMFLVEDDREAAKRFASRDIIYTGPIFGYKMKRADGMAGAAEEQILEQFGLSLSAFKPLRARGSRRAAILYPDDLKITSIPEGLNFRFSLPAGAYATTLLREFTRT